MKDSITVTLYEEVTDKLDRAKDELINDFLSWLGGSEGNVGKTSDADKTYTGTMIGNGSTSCAYLLSGNGVFNKFNNHVLKLFCPIRVTLGGRQEEILKYNDSGEPQLPANIDEFDRKDLTNRFAAYIETCRHWRTIDDAYMDNRRLSELKYSIYKTSYGICLLQDYSGGSTLDEYWAQTTVNILSDAVNVAALMLHDLDIYHRANLLNADVKSSNYWCVKDDDDIVVVMRNLDCGSIVKIEDYINRQRPLCSTSAYYSRELIERINDLIAANTDRKILFGLLKSLDLCALLKVLFKRICPQLWNGFNDGWVDYNGKRASVFKSILELLQDSKHTLLEKYYTAYLLVVNIFQKIYELDTFDTENQDIGARIISSEDLNDVLAGIRYILSGTHSDNKYAVHSKELVKFSHVLDSNGITDIDQLVSKCIKEGCDSQRILSPSEFIRGLIYE